MTKTERDTLISDLEQLVERTPDGPARYVLSLVHLSVVMRLEEQFARDIMPMGTALVQAAKDLGGEHPGPTLGPQTNGKG